MSIHVDDHLEVAKVKMMMWKICNHKVCARVSRAQLKVSRAPFWAACMGFVHPCMLRGFWRRRGGGAYLAYVGRLFKSARRSVGPVKVNVVDNSISLAACNE